MDTMVAILAFIVAIVSSLLLVNLLKKTMSAPPKAFNISINLSALGKICEESEDGHIDFLVLPEGEYENIKKMIEGGEQLAQAKLNKQTLLKIAYSSMEGSKTIREIIPFHIKGSIEKNEALTEYELYIDAFCLLRNEERTFHTNGISAAWYQGQGINLGDHLAGLCRKAKGNKEDQKKQP
jgi:hypothetical protein